MRFILLAILFTAILIYGIRSLDRKDHLNTPILSKEDNDKLSKLPRP